jgi:hypothetical protein
MKSAIRIALVAGLAFSGTACGSRQHLTATHGRAVTRALTAQVVHPEAGDKARTLPGFDAQESSIVVKGYRTSLAPEKAMPEDKGMVILAAPSRNTTPYLPPASVPESR